MVDPPRGSRTRYSFWIFEWRYRVTPKTSNERRLKSLHSDAASNCDRIGPDLDIMKGHVGEILITSIIEDIAKTGYMAVTQGGGVLLLRLLPHAQQIQRTRAKAPLDENRRAVILSVLESWPANAPRSLRKHAATMGVPLAELKKSCFTNPGRTQPPLRDAYESAREKWKRAYNDRRGGRRA